MQNAVKILGYIKGCSSSSPRPFRTPNNSVRCNFQKICNSSRRLKTILEIRKKAVFIDVNNKPINLKFLVSFHIPLPTIFKPKMRLKQSDKQNSFKHISKSLPNTHERTTSQKSCYNYCVMSSIFTKNF